ncbi:MAG: DUF115 domain-containing protein [Treponema sp.]|jgi:hypothetical protein|nr:DUF115 domain-containing protein [Treponema sp.]
MSFWEKNRDVLQQKYPGLLEEITACENDLAPEDIKIETAPTGDPALCVRGIYVHSPRDPVREAQRLVQTANTEDSPIVILGFGLGYSAQAAAKTRAKSGCPVVIVEKYKSLLFKALELRDLTDFLSEKNLIFVIGAAGNGIINAMAIANEIISSESREKKPAKKKLSPSVIRNRALVDLDKEWYGAVEEKIHTLSMKDNVNTATLKRFGKRWVRNLSRNMTAIRDCPGISCLSGLAAGEPEDNAQKNLPVFLAAAGPSLDKIAPLLHEIHSRCIVVALDTSLRFFVKNGVQPDFVLVVDPQFWNSRHLDRCLCENTALIAESAVFPPVLRLPFKKTFLCGSLFPLGTFIEKQVDPKGRLGSGGSVATTAWDFARCLGASGGNVFREKQEIWIAGLDLAFPELKTHFHGARFEEKANSESDRFNPAETWITRALRDGFPLKAPCASGGQVLTDRRLSLYAAWFENQFSSHSQIRNLALFQNGLAITGLENASPETLLALPNRRKEINKRLEAAFSKIENEFNKPEEKQKRAERYENAVSVLTRGLESIRSAAEEGASVTKRALNYTLNPSQQNKILKELDEITRRITDSEVKEIAGFLFPPAEDEETGNVSGDPFRAYLKSSLKLFSSLAETVEFNLKAGKL